MPSMIVYPEGFLPGTKRQAQQYPSWHSQRFLTKAVVMMGFPIISSGLFGSISHKLWGKRTSIHAVFVLCMSSLPDNDDDDDDDVQRRSCKGLRKIKSSHYYFDMQESKQNRGLNNHIIREKGVGCLYVHIH